MLTEQIIEYELRGPGLSGHRRSQGVQGHPAIRLN